MKLPSDPKSELGIIGCCLIGGTTTATEAVERITSDVFFREDCGKAWSIIETFATTGDFLDLERFVDAWKQNFGNQTPVDLLNSALGVPSAINLEYYIEPVIECARLRRLAYAAQDVMDSVNSKSADQIISNLETALDSHTIISLDAENGLAAATGFTNDMEARMSRQGKLSGIETGFASLDQITDGLQFGEQTIIGARPSVGKTMIGMNIVQKVCLEDQIPTLVISLEMRSRALMRRLCSGYTRIEMSRLRDGSLVESDLKRITKFTHTVSKSPLHIIDGTATTPDVNRVCAAAKRMVRKHGIKLIVLDYIQKLRSSGKHEKRTYEVGEVSQALNALSKATETAVVTLAQLNRESDRDKGRLPKLSDLGDSKQLEQDGDLILLLHRDLRETPEKGLILVAKQRDGETGIIKLRCDGKYCRFENTNQEEE